MSVIRFYVRNADGSIEGDETCVNDRRDLSSIAKGFTVLGQRKEFVLEFDPPLLTPTVDGDEEAAVERVAKAMKRETEAQITSGQKTANWHLLARAAIAAYHGVGEAK